MGCFLVATKKRGPYWGAARPGNFIHLPQYDSFMGIGGPIGELLEMLIFFAISFHTHTHLT
jgi:hypothetical protein